MIDTKELRRLAQAATPGPDGVSLSWITLLQDFQQAANPAAISELLDRLEAAEKDIALKEKIIDSLGAELNAVAGERDALRAKNHQYEMRLRKILEAPEDTMSNSKALAEINRQARLALGMKK